MTLNDRIDQRLAQPGDDETDALRKRLSIYVLSFAAVATALFGVFLLDSFALLGRHYIIQGIMVAVGVFLILLIPGRWLFIVLGIILITGVIDPFYGHMISGGYTDGTLEITWALVGPIMAVMFTGRRSLIFLFAAGSLAVFVIGAMVDPIALARSPGLPYQTRVVSTASNLVVMMMVILGATVYLFNQMEKARRRADDLLLNILPAPISARLKTSPGIIADGFSEATVLFADIVDFTTMSDGADPIKIVAKLNEVFSDFDDLAREHGLEKIKTIGDAYMVAAGLPDPQANHVERTVEFARDMLQAAGRHRSWTGEPIRLRVGINTGPVVAGVIGRHKFIYDLWGDAVNVASRMESNGLTNQIQVTEAVRDKLDGRYQFEARDPIYIKGKGVMTTYILVA